MTEQKKAPVAPDVYTDEWIMEMGGAGSHEHFLQSMGENLRPRLAHVLKLVDLSPDVSVLDIGCGRGEIIVQASMLGAGRAVGVDYAESAVNVARNTICYFADRLSGQVSVQGADAKFLPFADKTFDRVLLLDIVEHLHDWELAQVLSEVRRVLRNDGYLVIHTLPNVWTLKVGYKLARLVVPRLPSQLQTKRDVFHVNEQSVVSLSRMLQHNGFACKVWTEDLMLAQARWRQKQNISDDSALDRLYARLLDPFWQLLFRMVMLLPLRVILANDLFAVAWLSDGPAPSVIPRTPLALTDRLLVRILGL
jgi:SAM-dependent methyltransferase